MIPWRRSVGDVEVETSSVPTVFASGLGFTLLHYSRLSCSQYYSWQIIIQERISICERRSPGVGQSIPLTPSELTYRIAPILNDIEIPQKAIIFDGTVRSPLNPSIARQEPSKANDAEWAAYGNSPRIALTRDDIIKLGKDPETSARWDRNYWRLDEDLYVGTLNLAHV